MTRHETGQLKEKQAEIAQQPQLYEVDEVDDEDEVSWAKFGILPRIRNKTKGSCQ